MSQINSIQIKKEFIALQTQIKDSGNGYDHFTLAQFPEGKTEPEFVAKVSREGRTGKVLCHFCEDPDARHFIDSKCTHAAVARTFIRQKTPEDRIYFVTFWNQIGYWKSGKAVGLSSVKRVCR